MNNLSLLTTEDYYKATLNSVRKTHTVVLDPTQWNALINLAELEYVMSKLPEREMTQKRIDDLSVLRVFTDGKFKYNGTLVKPIQPILNSTMFPLPKTSSSYYDKTSGMIKIGSDYYPIYLSGCRVDFKILGSWVPAIMLYSDLKSSTRTSRYRKPRIDKIYYEMAGEFITGYFPTGTSAAEMNIEYYTYPRRVFYDESCPADIDVSLLKSSQSNTNFYQAGNGSINSIFEEIQKREIIDIATRNYLEIVESARYKSMLNEFAIKNRNK